MTPEQAAAFVIVQAACAMAKIAGMQAENQQRVHRGESMAYTEIDFENVTRHNVIGHNDVLQLFQDSSR